MTLACTSSVSRSTPVMRTRTLAWRGRLSAPMALKTRGRVSARTRPLTMTAQSSSEMFSWPRCFIVQ